MVLEMGGKWPYSCSLVGYCYQDLFSVARSLLVLFSFSIFSIRFVNAHVVQMSISIDAIGSKKFCLILSIDCQSIAVHDFARHILKSLSVDGALLPRYVNFREPPFRVEMFLSCLKHMYSVSSTLIPSEKE